MAGGVVGAVGACGAAFEVGLATLAGDAGGVVGDIGAGGAASGVGFATLAVGAAGVDGGVGAAVADGVGDGVAVASKPSNPTRSIFSALKCVK